ncbi:hypothetical protein [Rivihabitans pingtungensis]|uniref:Uncharacterized protein n=1 Tax=Rivihabitans pingtungensis TaxID=1054498 RepID=A0A318LBQ7_9NEIS|nr:hypothetical protein [Rivihabitans pingtungensis]PXX79137.1 hypothetical protein DFR34_10827 [Rivihabitans pingtungensis]
MLKPISYDRKNQVVTYEVFSKVDDASRFVIQDQTFDRQDKVSNRQPHQYTFPSIALEPGEIVKVHLTEEGSYDSYWEGRVFTYELFAGFAKNAINRNGDTVTLLYKFNSVNLPPTP